mmetsp:Transcript_15598/g.39548  ORF Transcript_15598/g.39548 Transcript_15598/m.39548 type:complete len:98 (-) Transcript_15598:1623-1916(-)
MLLNQAEVLHHIVFRNTIISQHINNGGLVEAKPIKNILNSRYLKQNQTYQRKKISQQKTPTRLSTVLVAFNAFSSYWAAFASVFASLSSRSFNSFFR